jgi:D-alanyl-D-alanine dipeptidase
MGMDSRARLMPRARQKRKSRACVRDMLSAWEPRTMRATAFLMAIFVPAAALAGQLPAGFVYLRDIDPGIAQDMRYAGADNFTGQPLPGYRAGECVLRRDVAQALKRVQAELARKNLSLKTYDCYRPARAVRAFMRWANDGARAGAGKRFFPRLRKRNLFALGYIAARSAHSTGTAIDLTLIEQPAAAVPPFDPHAAYGPCMAPIAQRAPDNGVDMGTGFDCFDKRSHTASAAISARQKHWRKVLVAAMQAHGFRNYAREWWHFGFGPRPRRVYDFPIAAR